MAENWRPVPGYEGKYEVSDSGSVRSLDRSDSRGRSRRGKVLSQRVQTRGHRTVSLCRDGVPTSFPVHRLVLGAFVGPCPDGHEGCHTNGDPTDNRLSNLRWDTRSGNAADSVRHGTHAMASRTHCPQGHAYTAENTYIKPSGSRSCRECHRDYRKSHREERQRQNREYMRRRRTEQKVQAA